MEKYLYGAAVQGIQQFIFRTNELKDIVGASELVEQICSDLFQSLLYDEDSSKKLDDDKNAIVHAAGNIKYIFSEKELDRCRKVVREFPMKVVEFAPTVTVSQAVVRYEDKDNGFSNAVMELEKRLRAQRNRPMRSSSLGLMGIERSRQTGLPVVRLVGKNHFDASTFAKRFTDSIDGGKEERKLTTLTLCNKFFGEEFEKKHIAFDVERMTAQNDWLAIIHADGNGLGQIVMQVGKREQEFKNFSKNLDKATVRAANEAFTQIMLRHRMSSRFIPFRPIVLGGDDLTVICRADLALDFTKEFIDKFELYTHDYLEDTLIGKDGKEPIFTKGRMRDRLTACAGIVYMKSSFPFYAAYDLAEDLCKAAKKDAKRLDSVKQGEELPASCVMFYKIQDSITESYEEMVKRELTSHDNPNDCLEFGPYYLHNDDAIDGRWTIEKLISTASSLETEEGNAVKSALRKWTSLLLTNKEQAKQFKLRMEYIISNKKLMKKAQQITDGVERGKKRLYPVYDILAINTINSQFTK